MKTNNLILVLLLCVSNSFYSQDGNLDNTFNSTGTAVTNFGVYNSSVHSMVLQPDGKVVVAGTVFNEGDYSQFGLARFNNNGTPDTTFGNLGFAISNVPGKISLNSVALQSSGKILGEGEIFNNYNDAQFVLTRFNTDGSPDTSFGTNGTVNMDAVKIYTMLVQSDDKILVAGFAFDLINRDFLMIRYNADGSLDTGFGTNGIVSTNIGVRDFGYDMTFQPDGKIVLVGSTQNNNGNHFSDFAVLRYFNDGNLDSAFGTGGVVIIDLDDMDEAKSVEVEPDGKIVVAGWSFSTTTSNSSYKIIRLLPDGSLDNGFASNGIAVSPISLSAHQQIIRIQSNSKILISGTMPVGTKSNFALARYMPNGTLDTTFGVNGVVTTSDGNETYSEANAVLTQPDGKILAGGETGEASLSYHPQSILRRYNNPGL